MKKYKYKQFICFALFVFLQSFSSSNTLYATTTDNPFRVALTGKYPPFSFYGNDGDLAGFDVDVSRKIASRLGRNIQFVTTEWDGIIAGLLANRYDAIIGSMAITPKREESVNFSTPYYVSGAQLFIHKANVSTIAGLQDLKDQKVGVVLGETYERYLLERHPDIKTIVYKSTSDIFQDMMIRRLSGFVTDKLVGQYQINQSARPFLPAGELLYIEKIGIPVNKSNGVLLAKINSAIKELQQNGELELLHKKWFSSETMSDVRAANTVDSRLVAKVLSRGFAVTLMVAVLSLVLGLSLALPVGIILNYDQSWASKGLRFCSDFIRGTPVLIQLFFVYFGVGSVFKLSPITSAILTLAINSAAYMAEVIRSGLMAVNPMHASAAKALGLTKFQTFIYVVWPQAFRVAIPPLMNSMIALLKDTALISVISVGEVIRETQALISITFDPIKYYFIVAVMFYVVTLPLMKYSEKLEKTLKSRGYA